jgi:phenylpyruvate tautomerase PptA (4-oxalocrotonate tautomerase family)
LRLYQLTLNAGRSVEQKKAFCKAVTDALYARLGLRPEDVFINLIEVQKENWSLGAGPIGLVMAIELARYGVAVRIIDKAPSVPTNPS